jgi:release factor H-coupled RctB family protein
MACDSPLASRICIRAKARRSALGTIGGGNHFAELQTVEEILDASAFRKVEMGRQQLVVLVHSGSRGLGESVLQAHVEQHGQCADSAMQNESLPFFSMHSQVCI